VRFLIELADRYQPWVFCPQFAQAFLITEFAPLDLAGLCHIVHASEMALIMGFNIQRAVLDSGVRALHMRLLLKGS